MMAMFVLPTLPKSRGMYLEEEATIFPVGTG
jgi:hypothetical protein